jgi:hypothetical protein
MTRSPTGAPGPPGVGGLGWSSDEPINRFQGGWPYSGLIPTNKDFRRIIPGDIPIFHRDIPMAGLGSPNDFAGISQSAAKALARRVISRRPGSKRVKDFITISYCIVIHYHLDFNGKLTAIWRPYDPPFFFHRATTVDAGQMSSPGFAGTAESSPARSRACQRPSKCRVGIERDSFRSAEGGRAAERSAEEKIRG